jgi:predicted nucleic acid-binding protein
LFRTTAVIDNASLVYLSYLNKETPFFHYLQSLFHTIYFPTEVVKEYEIGLPKEPHRKWLIERLNPDQGFYRYCSTYDSIVMVTVENYKGIDKGEAEAYAQLMKVNARFIISDDKSFINALKHLNSNIKVYTTLHLISWLEHSKFLPNWNDLIKHIHKIRPFKSKELREAYLEVAEQLGLFLPKKTVSAKCSLSKIL